MKNVGLPQTPWQDYMTLSQALYLATTILGQAKIEDSSFEAQLLLCYVLGVSKAQLFSQWGRRLTGAELDRLEHYIQRRLLHEPIAYVLQSGEFYGIEFYLDSRVFIPRPETELLVEKTIEFAHLHSHRGNHFSIADIGTGSGNIAISLALTLPQARIYATDISAPALQVAETNCKRYKLDGRVKLLQGNLLEPLHEPVDIIVANLPYIKDADLETLSPEIVNFEPALALAGGRDGLDKIHSLLTQIPGKICPGGCFLLEIGQGQDKAVSSLINSYFPQTKLELFPDLSGIYRAVKSVF